VAAKAGRLECVRLLLQSACDPRPHNKGKQTPYQLAIAKGHQQVGPHTKSFMKGKCLLP
jgi:ankyrin repeat protein